MKKYYIKQTAPEWVDDPLFYHYKNKSTDRYAIGMNNDKYEENVIINKYNKDYYSFEPKFVEGFEESIDNLEYDITYDSDNSLHSIISWYFKKQNGKRYSNKELHDIKDAILNKDRLNDKKIIILNIITHKKWREDTIKGCNQNEWQNVIVSEDITKEDLSYIEMCYFNTGSEYKVYEEEEMEECINEFYIDSHNDKEQLAKLLKCEKDDIALYLFNGYVKTVNYKIV